MRTTATSWRCTDSDMKWNGCGANGLVGEVAADAMEQTRAQIGEYQRLRGLVRELVEVSGRICDARLDANKPAAAEKRGVSTRRSRRRSRPRSSG